MSDSGPLPLGCGDGPTEASDDGDAGGASDDERPGDPLGSDEEAPSDRRRKKSHSRGICLGERGSW